MQAKHLWRNGNGVISGSVRCFRLPARSEAEESRINACFPSLPACRSGFAGKPLKRYSRAGQSRPNAPPVFSEGSSGSLPLSAPPVCLQAPFIISHLAFSILHSAFCTLHFSPSPAGLPRSLAPLDAVSRFLNTKPPPNGSGGFCPRITHEPVL